MPVAALGRHLPQCCKRPVFVASDDRKPERPGIVRPLMLLLQRLAGGSRKAFGARKRVRKCPQSARLLQRIDGGSQCIAGFVEAVKPRQTDAFEDVHDA